MEIGLARLRPDYSQPLDSFRAFLTIRSRKPRYIRKLPLHSLPLSSLHPSRPSFFSLSGSQLHANRSRRHVAGVAAARTARCAFLRRRRDAAQVLARGQEHIRAARTTSSQPMARSHGGSAGSSVQLEHVLAAAHGRGDAFAAAARAGARPRRQLSTAARVHGGPARPGQ